MLFMRPLAAMLGIFLAVAPAASAQAANPRPAPRAAKKPTAKPATPAPPVASEDDEADPELDELFGLTPAPAAVPAPAPQPRGRAPKLPSAARAAGAARGQADPAVRRAVAGAAVDDDVTAASDPELGRLREADRVLFAKPLVGAVPGWSWDAPTGAPDGPAVSASGVPGAPDVAPPGTADELGSDAEWLRSLAPPNLPLRFDERVVRYLKFYRDDAQGRAILRTWARKSGRYLPALRAELAKAGLPTDLAYLSLIESAHNPLAYSPVGAAGLWQFMPDTARHYGLTVDRWVDERLDPERSTEAAAKYLADLVRRFGSWELAMAAYNMGHGALLKVVRKYNSNDFWSLARLEGALPWETTLYVPKILALAVAMNNKKAFGVEDVTGDAPVAFDVVRAAPGTPLADVARAAGATVAQIEAMNPAYRASRTPPSGPGDTSVSWRVKVPEGSGDAAGPALARDADRAADLDSYLVRYGDTARSIAARRGTTEAALRKLNRIEPGEELMPGAVLLVPRREGEAAVPSADAAGDDVVVVSDKVFTYDERVRVFYRVVPGDSLSRVAQALGVTRSELATWNALDGAARLHSGMVLAAWVKRDRDLSEVRVLREGQVRVLVAGTPEFVDWFEGKAGRHREIVSAEAGDTLASVGARYGLSIGWMERINRVPRSRKLVAGEKLVVYVRGAPSAPRTATATPAAAP